MNARKALRTVGIVFVLTEVLNALYYAFLPPQVPVHWNIRGQVDGWISKPFVFLVPVFALVLGALLIVWPKRSRTTGALDGVLNLSGVLAAALIGWVHWCSLQTAVTPTFPTMSMLLGALFVMFGVLGTQMSKLEPNPWAGIRVGWTMKDPVVWKETHKLASLTMTGGSVLGLGLLVLQTPIYVSLLVLFGSIFAPIPYAARRYKQRHPVGI